jgi:hypothetical protein
MGEMRKVVMGGNDVFVWIYFVGFVPDEFLIHNYR